MTQNIKLIPVLELPTFKDTDSENYPTGSSLTNPKEWAEYIAKDIRKNYKNIGSTISSDVYLYPLFDMDTDDLMTAIKLHISDLKIEDSCSFFGGYALSINEQIVLYPQCCGLLEEINDWAKILDSNFEPFYLTEGHPSPLFRKNENNVYIDCSDENDEPFFPATPKEIIVNYNLLNQAVENLIIDLKHFSKKLDKLSDQFDYEGISNILIWGKK